MNKERQILTLLQLRKDLQKQSASGKENSNRLHSSIGLIVDCSNVYKYESNRDYTQKLKIIDSTEPNQPTQIYLWSNRRQDFTLNIKIGDILYFNNFRTELYNGALQAKKAFKIQDSYFRIFSGTPELTNYTPIDKKVGLDDQDGKILTLLNNLRAYSKTYFKTNKVPLLFKPDAKSKDSKKVTSSDFDLILRVVESVHALDYHKIRLTNEKDEFHLNYTRHIEPGVYKIRSVADAKWEDKFCNLSGNDYTFFLQISNWMKSYDPKEWDRVICSAADLQKKKPRRAKIQTKILTTNKKIKKVDLKELFIRGTPLPSQTTTTKKYG